MNNNKPRVHHFVPQFWIRKFISADGNLWGYEWNDDRIKQRSSKAMMQVFDLYTIQPGGLDDTSLETNELGVIDADGATAFARVLSGDLSENARVDLATFLAAQIMRDPGTLASYPPKTQEYALALLGAVEATDYTSFASTLAAQFPGADVSQDEFDHLRTSPTAEQNIGNIICALDAAGGMPELPFTDLIRDPKGLDIIRNALLGLNWEMKYDANAGLILGDAAVLYETSHLGSGLRTPLSKTNALYLSPSQTPRYDIKGSIAKPHEVDDLNYESSARARKWLVGEQARIEGVRTQVTNRGFSQL
ncbi:DUF4238 domain-containing protein [Agrobacterium fabrum]|uniref:DUF4238 domain-containing protein n=1 Tax=Agrobacterium fabrum TaxID=1176649 RepID=UPI00298ED996|nr:DUF4238 domain-containing protein [Agrobacterium fabrum]